MASDSLYNLAAFSAFSHDPRTQNAARLYEPDTGLFSSTGYNQVPSRLDPLDGRLGASGKVIYVEHAERAAIYTAAREGFRTSGCEMHALWAACPECARAIICAGIVRVHTCAATFSATPKRWKLTVMRGLAMLDEAGVDVVFHRDLGTTIRFDGKELEI